MPLDFWWWEHTLENVQVVGARNTYDWSSSHEKLYPHSQTCWHIDLTALFSWVCLKEMIEHWATFIPYIYNIKLYLLYIYIFIFIITYYTYHIMGIKFLLRHGHPHWTSAWQSEIASNGSLRQEIWADCVQQYGVFLSHGGTPKPSMYRWIFHEINHPAIGVPPFMETKNMEILQSK